MSVSGLAPMNAAFVFATCSKESTAWLKRDVTRLHPELRLAFSRPGFVSWKWESLSADPLRADIVPQSAVASVCGWGIGQAKTIDELVELVSAHMTKNACLHVFALERQPHDPEVVAQTISTLQAALLAIGSETRINVPARVDQKVVDVIVLDAKRWFVGWHAQSAERFGGAGGVEPQVVDATSPSRAYAKVAELLRLGELDLRPRDTVVELGAAPGGGTLYLLQRGAHVWAVDPAPLAPSVLKFAPAEGSALTALQMAAGNVNKEHLPKRVDYLISDVNLAPTVSLRYLERLCALGRPRAGILVNLKVNDERAEALLPSVLERVRTLGLRIGLARMRVGQVPSHRREVGVVLRRVNA